ncbi:MAG: CAP domain-containing protein [Micrococcales bacterium]|nr:CAP domain-containing protein [Micrococcales bacterium]MCL2666334.1 CAP domain-containing protein [Micrococcales bacterium]
MSDGVAHGQRRSTGLPRLLLVVVIALVGAGIGGGAALIAMRDDGEQVPAADLTTPPAAVPTEDAARNTPPAPSEPEHSVTQLPPVGGSSPVPTETTQKMERDILDLVNAQRTARGVEPLSWSLCARRHAETFVSEYVAEGWLDPVRQGKATTVRNPFVHKDMTAPRAGCAVDKSGSPLNAVAAENVWRGVIGSYGAPDVVNGWVKNAADHKNVLDPNMAQVGVYCYADVLEGTKRLMCSAIFIS